MEKWILHGVFVLSAMTASLGPAHMMQLASYQTPGYMRWLRESSGRSLSGFLPVAVLALLGLFQGYAVPWVGVGVLVLLAVTCRPRKAKKPFKATSRAVRLLFVQLVLLCGVAAYSFVFGDLLQGRLGYVALATGYIGVLGLVVLSNAICLPVQKMVNNYYIRDARRMLRNHPDLTIIGVTGSYGKTSFKNYLSQLLSVKYEVLITPESYNTPMGIVRTIRERLRPTHKLFVCEMGARHVGDIRENCQIAAPLHGVVTSIGPQHLETFKSIENIVSTKFELIDALPPQGIAFLAWDNPHIRTHKTEGTVVKYGLGEGCGYTALDLQVDAAGLRFTARTPDGEEQSFATGLLGRHTVENLIGAIAAAHTLGVSLPDMVQPIRTLKPVPHRLALMPKGNGVTVIDDAYNANPSGTRAALDALAMFDALRVMITPGMVELGEQEETENRAFGVYAAGVCDYVALVGEKHTAPIAEGLRQGGLDKRCVKSFGNLKLALDWVWQLERNGRDMVVLLENDLPDNYG